MVGQVQGIFRACRKDSYPRLGNQGSFLKYGITTEIARKRKQELDDLNGEGERKNSLFKAPEARERLCVAQGAKMLVLAGALCVSRGRNKSRVQMPLSLAGHFRGLGLNPKGNGALEGFYGLSTVCSRKMPASSASRSPAKQPPDSSSRG